MFDRKIAISLLLFFVAIPLCQGQFLGELSRRNTDVYGGYSYTTNNFIVNQGGVSGWDAGVDLRTKKWLDAAMEISGYDTTLNFGEHLNMIAVLFGPQLRLPVRRMPRASVFGEFLIGAAVAQQDNFFVSQKFTNSTEFAWTAQGGLDYRLRRHLALRAQGGYLYSRFHTALEQAEPYFPAGHPRVSSGVVYRF